MRVHRTPSGQERQTQAKMILGLQLVLGLWLSLVAADLPTLPANIEVDIIFPRNETYAPADNFPIILALQNAPLAWDFGFILGWDLRNVTLGRTSSQFVDGETIVQSDTPKVAAPADTFFIANYTTRLDGDFSDGIGTYRLSWDFALSENCTRDGNFINYTIGAGLASGDLVFTIANGGKAVDLTEGGSCPPTGGAVGISANISGCAHVDNAGVTANPCNVVIDDSLASTLYAQLPSITTSTSSAPTSTITTKTTAATSGTASKTTLSTTTSATGNSAPDRGNFQAAAAAFAGAAGCCALLV